MFFWFAGLVAANGAGVIVNNFGEGPGDTLYANADGTLMDGGLVAMGYFPASVTAEDIDTAAELVRHLSAFTVITSAVPGSVNTTLGTANPGYVDQAEFTQVGPVLYGDELFGRMLYSVVISGGSFQALVPGDGVGLVPIGTFKEDLPVEWQYSSNPTGYIPLIGGIGSYTGDPGAGEGKYQTLLLESLVGRNHTVALVASPAGGGSVAGEGTWATGGAATFTAQPGPGYLFVGWEGAITGSASTLHHVFTFGDAEQMQVTARFAPDTADDDADGLTNFEEIVTHQTDPADADTDDDGLEDGPEVLLHGTSALLADTDGDGLGDAGELRQHRSSPLLVDTDGDGLTDPEEVALFPSYKPHEADSDGDGVSDGLEDFDSDRLGNLDELRVRGTSPVVADTDLDGLLDGDELFPAGGYASDPLVADADGDGFNDRQERDNQTSPVLADTDADGLSDREEVLFTRTNPLRADSDSDGIADAAEDPDEDGLVNLAEVRERRTDPLKADSDADSLTDGLEVRLGWDPLADSSDLIAAIRDERDQFGLFTSKDVTDLRPGSVRMNPTGTGKPVQVRLKILKSTDFKNWTVAGEALYEEPYDPKAEPNKFFRFAKD